MKKKTKDLLNGFGMLAASIGMVVGGGALVLLASTFIHAHFK